MKQFFGFLCALLLFLTGCLSEPEYAELASVQGAAIAKSGPLTEMRLGMVYSDNTLGAFEYMKRHERRWYRQVIPFLEEVDPKYVSEHLNGIVQQRFKSAARFASLEEAAKEEVDLILVFDFQCVVAQEIGQNTTVDVTGTFMTRNEQVIDSVKGSGFTTPPYFSFTFRFEEALDLAFEQFLSNLDKSAQLKAFGERRIVPASASRMLEIRGKTAPLPTGGYYHKSWGVVIGINKYDVWPPLEYAVNDALAMEEKLKETGFDEVIKILDKEATRERILTLLGGELPKKVGSDDRVVIFFAGHGQTESLPDGQEHGYIIPVDGDITNYFATAISMTQVRELSQRIPAKHLLYVMDACYSGHGFTRAGGLDPAINGYIEKITSLRSVQMITAGGKNEQVMESQGHGIFTQYFLRGLNGEADRDADGVVTASELGAFLMPQVSRASGNLQTPQYGRLDGEGEVVFLISTEE